MREVDENKLIYVTISTVIAYSLELVHKCLKMISEW